MQVLPSSPLKSRRHLPKQFSKGPWGIRRLGGTINSNFAWSSIVLVSTIYPRTILINSGKDYFILGKSLL